MSCMVCPQGDPDPACVVCHGTGEWQLTRCPHAFAGEDAKRAVSAANLIEIGVLPVAGGWDEQTALFCQAAGLALRERREVDEARRQAQAVTRGQR